ncbi:BolA family protein [Solemya velum gill symbiont]|uniref:DNA-binding transcriptional regulator BolA n=1 Tax=Solemya velum gill symbiont TaxID=2340 RepID=A0A1T2ENZ8_SOVGS|nr:BolA/IbaG family iron-sulfur metabolism protein [Solemya velum gill symbiont]OOY35842.1 BolA family transcriptional regulator [Solemya velum gill symbiont]OOY38683.1 BolA family transcriptional regulator [Solemya velum gill symbiont]OOY40379.1 BolA family transcriptional regulator [Solemya velum gill symbiont]OOY44049.1 BolA family transcriptional regulator [Solemya velum gill symbiont]OOY46560.1 BolA family transcriptional regulator [Solemya velum gill symbiont]
MSRKEEIEHLLQESFTPMFLEVADESHMHSVPEGSESHFKVTLVSDQFDSKPLVQRHRAVNSSLAALLADGIHALALHTMTPEEWFAKGGVAPDSPPCLGGSKK